MIFLMPARGYGWWTFEQKGRGLIFFYWFSTNYEMTFFLCHKLPHIQVCVEEKETFKEMFALLRYTLLTSTSLARPLSKITIIDMRRFLYQGLGLHDVCHLELLDKPWLSDPLHLCSGNASVPFVHHTLTIIIIYSLRNEYVIFSSSLLCSFKGQRTEAGPDSCSRKLSCWTNWSVSKLNFFFYLLHV